MMLAFDPADFSWGHGGGGFAYALQVGGVDIDVHVDSPQGSLEPMAPIARRGVQGKLLSAITATRGQKLDKRFATIPLDSSDADTQEAALLAGIPVTCAGWLLGGSLTALPYDVGREPIAGGALFIIHFGLLES